MSSRAIFVEKFRMFLRDHHTPSHIRVIITAFYLFFKLFIAIFCSCCSQIAVILLDTKHGFVDLFSV